MGEKIPQTDSICKNTVDRRAQQLVDNWTSSLRKLRDLKPEIEWIRDEFKNRIVGSETILGCRNFKAFCLTHLKRSEQAVYALLGDYSAKAQAKKQAAQRTATTSSTAVSTLPTDSVEALREAVEVAGASFAAMKQGDTATAEKMAQEFEAIKAAHKPSSPMFDFSKREMLGDFISANLDLYSRIENGLKDGISIKQLQTHVEAMRKRFAPLLGKHVSAPTQRTESKTAARSVYAAKDIANTKPPDYTQAVEAAAS